MTAAAGDIDLNDVIPALRRAGSNHIEFYDASGLARKTMAQVDADVRAAESVLRGLGLSARGRIGILGWTSYQWVVIDLACLAGGFVTVPLDPEVSWPRDRIARDFALDIVLTNHSDFVDAGGCFVSFDRIFDKDAACASSDPAHWEQHEPFTVIFTSGTTGEPKIIEVKKECFDDQFSNALPMFDITRQDKILVFLPMHIYLERCYVYLAILREFNVVVAPTRFVLKALKAAEFTFAVGIPQFFSSLQDLFLLQIRSHRSTRLRCRTRLLLFRLNLGFSLRRPFAPFQRLLGGRARFFLTGSAPCPLPTLRFYQAMGIPIYEGYGMSEIAGMIALNYPGNTKLGTVGRVFPHKEVKLDSSGQILVRSAKCAINSYWRAPDEINAATFGPDGWVATGDVGQFDSDGYLTIKGRVKDVVVLSNGRKVQPAPIEAEINCVPFVDYSVVVGDDRPYLVALVSVKAPNLDTTELDACFRRLNQSRPEADQVRKYHVLTERFTAENGLLTHALKLNRQQVKQRYAAVIDNLYAP